MVDHNDEFGSSAPPPEGDPAHAGFGEPNLEGLMGDPTSPHGEAPEGYGGHEAHFKHPHPPAQSAPEDGARHPTFPMVLGAIMVVILVVAWAANMSKTAPAPAASPAPAAGTADTAAAPPPEKAAEPTPDPKAMTAAIDGLKSDLKALQDRIDALPKPAPAPDLGPLNARITELSSQTEALAALPKKVDDLDQRLGSFDKTLTALRGDLDTLKSDVKKAHEASPAPAAAETPKVEDGNVADAAFDQAVGQFKAGKYKEASDAFQKLTEAHPNDARVWYFAALSRGSATGQWTGDTTKMVEKAVEREKAGTPASAKIDAAFSDINASFKPWLDAYRKMAKAP